MGERPVMVVTGTRKGLGRKFAETFVARGYVVYGCSRNPIDLHAEGYTHACLDVADDRAVRDLFRRIGSEQGRLDTLINNAGVASMNHVLLTPAETVERILRTNVTGTFLFSREAAKLMQRRRTGRIVNLTSVVVPLKLEGEAIYASSKAAVITLTQVLARELGAYGITVNAVGPTLVPTDLIRSVPQEKLQALVARQAIRRFGTFEDLLNVVDFFLQPGSDFITGQTIFLGGV